MRLRSQLILALSVLLVSALSLQLWMQHRQLDALKGALDEVATSVGRVMVLENQRLHGMAWVSDDADATFDFTSGGSVDHIMKLPIEAQPEEHAPGHVVELIGAGVASEAGEGQRTTFEMRVDDGVATRTIRRFSTDDDMLFESVQNIELKVVHDDDEGVVIFDDGSGEPRIFKIPESPSKLALEAHSRQVLFSTAGLFLAGLFGAVLVAHRTTKPLGELASAAERVGQGELGQVVELGGSLDVVELQRAFNQMSTAMAAHETERAQFAERERLAELGELARGLAHTLRNPLHTLGLAVDELAINHEGGAELADEARGQIRRIDGWMRSFLAVSTNGGAERSELDFVQVVEATVFERAQTGAAVSLELPDAAIALEGVEVALRAALANLVDNAIEASPEGSAVEVTLQIADEQAVLEIADRGPGLPSEVREHLFSPMQTTKAAGSGMGLYLAQQILVAGHGGKLELVERPGGGTIARVSLPVTRS